MATEFGEFIAPMLGAFVGGAAAYAAVKEKMGELLARIVAAENGLKDLKVDTASDAHRLTGELNHAHARLDAHIERFHSK